MSKKWSSSYVLRLAQMRKYCCRNILSQCCSQCCMGEQMGKKQHIFAFKMQILRLQDTLLGYANEETFGKYWKSVFLQCFPSDSSFAPQHNICWGHKSASWKQKMLLKFSKNIFGIHFCFCNNVSLFELTFIIIMSILNVITKWIRSRQCTCTTYHILNKRNMQKLYDIIAIIQFD